MLLCSASSVAICMRASSTRALSSHVYQSSSSCRKLDAPVASDTFLVASLHRRSMKPGMFRSVTGDREDRRGLFIDRQNTDNSLKDNHLQHHHKAGIY